MHQNRQTTKPARDQKKDVSFPKQKRLLDFFFRLGESCFLFLERHTNRSLGESQNWFYYLGAIPILLMIVLLFTGLYLFIYYDLSLQNAYDSIKNVNDSGFGNLMRSMHRYAADGMILFACLHFFRMFFKKFYQNHRWLAWVSGVGILVFLLIQGITGYILPQDSTANFVMQETAKLLSSVRVFGDTLSRSFATPGNTGKWILWILMIVHLALPMLVLFGIFIHVKRISRARILPPKPLIWAVVIALLLFSLLFPVEMLKRGNPYQIAYLEEMDWFYLFLTPLLKYDTSLYIWGGFFGSVLLLLLIPWLGKKTPVLHAMVDAEACTGCTLCAADCPYEAIAMRPTPEGRHKFLAEISPNLCSGCGICIGACDFSALHLKHESTEDPHLQIRSLLSEAPNKGSIQNGADAPVYLGVACKRQSQNLEKRYQLKNGTLEILVLECVGKFGVSMLRTASEAKAAGILALPCPKGDCNFREGNKWLRMRMFGMRKPKFGLVKNAPPLAILRLNGDEKEQEISEQCEKLIKKSKEQKKSAVQGIARRPRAWFVSILALLLLFSSLYFASPGSSFQIPFDQNRAVVRLDFFYMSQRESCKPEALDAAAYKRAVERVTSRIKMENLTPEARRRIIESARKTALAKFCSRRRRPILVKLFIDKKLQFKKSFVPSGLQKDGLVYALYEKSVPLGKHKLRIELSHADEPQKILHRFEEEVDFFPARKYFIDFEKNKNQFTGR